MTKHEVRAEDWVRPVFRLAGRPSVSGLRSWCSPKGKIHYGGTNDRRQKITILRIEIIRLRDRELIHFGRVSDGVSSELTEQPAQPELELRHLSSMHRQP